MIFNALKKTQIKLLNAFVDDYKNYILFKGDSPIYPSKSAGSINDQKSTRLIFSTPLKLPMISLEHHFWFAEFVIQGGSAQA
jgi:hypothetical protein